MGSSQSSSNNISTTAVDKAGIQRDEVEGNDCEFFTNVLREQCYINCNPGAFKQRLIKGGRDSDEHWAKLQVFKETCALGCDFAAASPHFLPKSKRNAIIEAQKRNQTDSKLILPSDVLEKRLQFHLSGLESLRGACYSKCATHFPDNLKQQRMCGDGCDSFLDNVKD